MSYTNSADVAKKTPEGVFLNSALCSAGRDRTYDQFLNRELLYR
jgi:hypothetical protein